MDYCYFGGKRNEYTEFLAYCHEQQKEKWCHKVTKVSESAEQIFVKFDVEIVLYKTSQRHRL